MKNLEVWNLSRKQLNSLSSEDFVVCHGQEDDNFTVGAHYICTSNLIISQYDEKGLLGWTKDLTELASPSNNPVNITYLSLREIVNVGLGNGEIFSISDAGQTCEHNGVFNCGLLAMEWSPDQEILVLVAKDLTVVLLSCGFDPVTEVTLLDEDFGQKQFINVGWGKKETQFHGSAGKQAAKLNNEVIVDPNTICDNKIKISWRGDGQLYAVSYSVNQNRKFKVFDRTGVLFYTSENQRGLEGNLAWKPSGDVIATTQMIQDRYIVSFFEKNGLKHREFDLNLKPTEVVEDIAWSNDSEILTLQCLDKETDTQRLLLYTAGNYHWYLKQTLRFSAKQKIIKLLWDCGFDVLHNKRLRIFLQNGEVNTYDWVWVTHTSKGKSNMDDAIVAVIDDKKLLITSFRQAVVPPPMATLEVTLDDYPESIHFAPADNIDPNSFLVTTNKELVFFEQTQKMPLQYKQHKKVLDNYEFLCLSYNWFWLKSDTVICIMVNHVNRYELVEYAIEDSKMNIVSTSCMPSSVTRIVAHPHKLDSVFIQLESGELILYTLGRYPEPSTMNYEKAFQTFSVVKSEDNLHYIGLTHKGFLYIDDASPITCVSSFFVHTHFLLITTLNHELLCAELTEAGISAIKKFKTNKELAYVRRIERGAKLVVVVPCDNRTVLQMPRGNLEAIQPRPLSLKIICKYLDSTKYYEAFDLMRKQRINLNLIYDHNPEKFIDNIHEFLESIRNNSWLNLFLSDLENSDVTKTMYANSYLRKNDRDNENNNSKIIKVCDLVRDEINKRSDKDTKILPVITTFVKKNTVEELEKALLIIKELKLKESGGSKLPLGSDEALKYLLYMVDVNQLFDVALGMYDFDLALLIANKSQKDPKEYIPMLNEFNDMDENYKRFTINKHLKRFDNAVECLVKCGSTRHEELRTFVKYHSLYRESLALLLPEDDVFKQISDDYGHYLKLKKQYTQAGIVYERANNIEKTISCYKDALEWELALTLGQSLPKEEFKMLCGDLIRLLQEEKRHQEALIILEQYYDNYEETILYAIECGQYKTALRLCSHHQKNHLKDEKLLPALLEDFKNIKEAIETQWSTFIRHRERLFIVRENKFKNPQESYDFHQKDSDLYSDAGSTIASSSRGSTRSHRSSKNRRKHERKMASLKEGSPYEDVALVMALHKLITASHGMRLQVRETVIALSHFGKNKEAVVLQTTLSKLLKEMKDSFKTIWTNELLLDSTNALIDAANVPEGQSIEIQGVASLDAYLRIAPVIQETNWKLDGLD